MAKKRCWFGWVRKLFISEEKPKTEKKSKRWRWIIGRLKFKQCPALPAPQRTVNDVTEAQRKHALTVALATAAAAEAAVAAAQAAAEVVRLTGASQSYHNFINEDENVAATKIQSAFRAYLARKALRALKGVVKLQALVRGQAVRHQALIKLKRLPSNAKMQSEVQAKSITPMDGICKSREYKQLLKSVTDVGVKENKLESNSQRSWDFSMLSKEDMKALCLRKQAASIKRERMMKYSFSHREKGHSQILDELLPGNGSGRQNLLMERWVDKESYNREGAENLKSCAISNLLTSDVCGAVQIKTRTAEKQDPIEGLNSPVSFPRRSFGHTQRNTALENSSMPNSPVLPTYMAATQSAKARARSLSTPKQRGGSQDACFDRSLPHKNGLCFWSSYNGEPFGTRGKSGASHHLSDFQLGTPMKISCLAVGCNKMPK